MKQRIVKDFAKRFGLPVLVETGTYMGDMIGAVKTAFEEIYSIELGMDLFRNATKRFAGDRHVVLLHGDSGDVLGQVLPKLRRPCLFWLDAHYSSGSTAGGDLETPIERELGLIARHPFSRDHVILIDDARNFTGDADYPSMQTLREWASKEGFKSFEVKDDIIRMAVVHDVTQRHSA